jgi:hypothetical protein
LVFRLQVEPQGSRQSEEALIAGDLLVEIRNLAG